MKQPLKLKKNNWVINELNLNNKKQGKVIEKGLYESSVEGVDVSYIITYQSKGYIRNQFNVKITLNVIHHHDQRYDVYSMVMVTSFHNRIEFLNTGLEKIMYEINHHMPYYQDVSLLKETHHYSNY